MGDKKQLARAIEVGAAWVDARSAGSTPESGTGPGVTSFSAG